MIIEIHSNFCHLKNSYSTMITVFILEWLVCIVKIPRVCCKLRKTEEGS